MPASSEHLSQDADVMYSREHMQPLLDFCMSQDSDPRIDVPMHLLYFLLPDGRR